MGVVGRYDGASVNYRITPKQKVKLITGIPFETNSTVKHRSDKYFYSLGYEIGPFYRNWETTIYFLEQIADGVTDRTEKGMEIRHRTPETSFFSLIDYSTEYSTLNYFMLVLNLRLADKSSLDIIANYRKSPFLTTTNALQNQVGVSSLGDLLETLTAAEIEQLSIERT